MSPNHKKLGEQIIELHKQNNGKCSAHEIHNNIEFEQSTDSILIIKSLKELDLLTNFDKHNHITMLTQKGWNFQSFEVYENNLKAIAKQEEEIRSLTIKELKGNIFQLKYWWLLLLISAVISFVVGNIDLIIKLVDAAE